MMRPLAKNAKRLASAAGLEYLVPKIDELYTWWTIAEPEESVDASFWFAWADWAKEAGPWRWWFRNDLTQFVSKYMVRPFVDLYWWWSFRFNPRHIHHVIRPTGLKPGFISVNDKMLHAWMQIICDYVEQNGLIDGTAIERDPDVTDEALDLYRWWKTKDAGDAGLPEMPELPEGWTWDMTMDPAMQDTPFVEEVRRVSSVWAERQREKEVAEDAAIERLVELRKKLIV